MHAVARAPPRRKSASARAPPRAWQVFTYLYYAQPRLFRVARRWITQIQIAQHVIVCASLVYALTAANCDAPPRVVSVSLAVYLVYLVQFARFYHKAYLLARAPKCHGS